MASWWTVRVSLCVLALAALSQAVQFHEQELQSNLLEIEESPIASSAISANPSSASITNSVREPPKDEQPQTDQQGKDQIQSKGVNKVFTDAQGNHLIFLTNQNYLSQNLATSNGPQVATAAAGALADHLVELAKRKAREQLRAQQEEQQKVKVSQQNADKVKTEDAEKKAAQNEEAEKRSAVVSNNLVIKLEKPYENFGGEYKEASATMIKGSGICVVSGLLRGDVGLVMTLGAACRPYDGRLVFSLLRGDVPARVDVLPDGRVYVIAGGSGATVSLDGMIFPAKVSQNVQLLNNWVGYADNAAAFRSPSLTTYKSLNVLSGVIRGGNWNQPFGRVAEDTYPGGRLIFSANSHQFVVRADLVNTGYFIYSGGDKSHGWVSLDGLVYTAGTGGLNLQLKNGWVNFENEYRPARYELVENLCVVSGLVKNDGDWKEKSEILVLPEVCRPSKRLVFGTNVQLTSARVDVTPLGQVIYIRGKQQFPWLSLTGISFVPATASSKA